MPRVVPTLHVRAALAAVESENAEAGIVYRTDAAASKRARIAFEVAREQGPPIRYPVAPLVRSTHRAASALRRATCARPRRARSSPATASSCSEASSLLTREELEIVGFSLATAAGATLVILPLGVLAALALARYRGPGKGALETLLSLPLVLPPTAVGLVLLELLGRRSPLGGWLASHGLEVVFTWKAVVLAMAVMSFPLLVRSARTAFEEVDPRLVGLARTLGCGPLAAFLPRDAAARVARRARRRGARVLARARRVRRDRHGRGQHPGADADARARDLPRQPARAATTARSCWRE